jgi:hypothetical protein
VQSFAHVAPNVAFKKMGREIEPRSRPEEDKEQKR